MNERVKEKLGRLTEALRARKAVLLILLVGLALLLLPTGGGDGKAPESAGASQREREDLEERLEAILSRIEGAGRVQVLLSPGDDGERVLARDERTDQDSGGRTESESEAVTVSQGSGRTGEVEISYRYPAYRGAVVCAEGADSAQVRLDLLEAVKAATGLGAEAIKIVKMGATP